MKNLFRIFSPFLLLSILILTGCKDSNIPVGSDSHGVPSIVLPPDDGGNPTESFCWGNSETAWGGSGNFSGRNWAKYIEFDTQNGDYQTFSFNAGQNNDAGSITVYKSGDALYITYNTSSTNWYIDETHLHVATRLSDIPQRNGNPTPGRFAYSATHSPRVNEYTYTVNVNSGCSKWYIAAHGVAYPRVSCE